MTWLIFYPKKRFGTLLLRSCHTMTCKTFQIQTISVLNGRFYGTCCVWPNRFFNGLAFGEEPDIDWDWFFFSLWLTSMKSIWERFSDYVPLNDGGDHIPRLLWTKNHLQFVLYTVRVCFCCCCARPHDIWEASNLNPEKSDSLKKYCVQYEPSSTHAIYWWKIPNVDCQRHFTLQHSDK